MCHAILYICHIKHMLYNVSFYGMLYKTCHVMLQHMLYNMFHVMLYNICYITSVMSCHVMLRYDVSCYVI